jgi:hypothetical protein
VGIRVEWVKRVVVAWPFFFVAGLRSARRESVLSRCTSSLRKNSRFQLSETATYTGSAAANAFRLHVSGVFFLPLKSYRLKPDRLAL